ncbi:MAG: hypothetical protein NTZ85_01650 [Bacteroidia bacterium]|nr:hypothetical protein [Bacteroidia bacterium]
MNENYIVVKSKKTGRIQTLTEDQYAKMVDMKLSGKFSIVEKYTTETKNIIIPAEVKEILIDTPEKVREKFDVEFDVEAHDDLGTSNPPKQPKEIIRVKKPKI